jgi:hypothetical protein
MAGAARRRLLTQAGFETANPVDPTISLSHPKHIIVGSPWRALMPMPKRMCSAMSHGAVTQ